MPARCDSSDQHSITDFISGHAVADLVNDSHWLVTDDQTGLYRVFAFQDVEIGTADGCKGNADDHFTRSGFRDRHGFQADVSWSMKHQGLHGRGVMMLFHEQCVRAV